MQAWVYRARDLGIISQATAADLRKRFRAQGRRKAEPGDPIPQEAPERLERLVLRALAENVITESRASELLDKTSHWPSSGRSKLSAMPDSLPRYVLDTNVIIDFDRGALLDALFALPLTFVAPDVLIEELVVPDGRLLVDRGLRRMTLTDVEVVEVMDLHDADRRRSCRSDGSRGASPRPLHQ